MAGALTILRGRPVNHLIVILKNAVSAFVQDGALGRGAAIAFYTVTSIAPLLLIVIAIAGLVFGQEAAQNGIVGQLEGMMGKQSAELLQTTIASSQNTSSGIFATVFGIVMILITASGVFGEMQAALNSIWKADPAGTSVSRLIRARATSLGLVASLGFLLMASLVVSTALAAFGEYINAVLPFGATILAVLNGILSLSLLTVLFAAIYKVLPDCHVDWRDVAIGAVATAILFMIGK
ncbi:MAG: YihY/virulence factor BrkB family protein, partial [Oxalobacteraceae bacterium]